MTKDDLEKRIALINAEMLTTKANFTKLEGHLQECEHWLKALIEAEQACESSVDDEVGQ